MKDYNDLVRFDEFQHQNIAPKVVKETVIDKHFIESYIF